MNMMLMTNDLELGSLTLKLWTGISCQISSGIRLEIKCITNVMHSNHPETIPLYPWKMVIRKTSAWCQERLGIADLEELKMTEDEMAGWHH